MMNPNEPQEDLRGLCLADAQVLDRLVDSGFQRDALENLDHDERRRADATLTLFNLLNDYPVEDDQYDAEDDVLIDATLARIRRDEEARSARFRIAARREESGDRKRRIPMPDFISIAAIILIAVGVLWPVIGEVRQRSIDAGCVANLASLGTAFQTYASDFNGRVPVQTAAWGPAKWVDPDRLVRHDYCEYGHVSCPGHTYADQPGYSRQLLIFGGEIRWEMAGAQPIMGDRNPLIDPRLDPEAEYLDPRMNSISHGKRGQNVLNMDGSVTWLEHPFVGSDDNIWLPRGRSAPEPGVVPVSDNDIFLVHPASR